MAQTDDVLVHRGRVIDEAWIVQDMVLLVLQEQASSDEARLEDCR